MASRVRHVCHVSNERTFMRFVLPLFSSLCLSVGACITPAGASALPEPVDRALREAEAQNKLRVSYTMTFRWRGAPEIVTRYDANQDRWSVIKGSPDGLDENGRKKFETYKRVESKPGGLTYADYRDHLDSVVRDGEDGKLITYDFVSPQTPGDLEKARTLVDTEIAIDKTHLGLVRYQVRAKQAFKPNPVSKLDDFEFIQTFERRLDATPPLMTRVYWRARGKRLFASVDEEYTVLFSDFERTQLTPE